MTQIARQVIFNSDQQVKNFNLNTEFNNLIYSWNLHDAGNAGWDFLVLGQASSVTGILKFFNSSSTHATGFKSGNSSADITYTFPTAGPAGNNYVLGSSTLGVMSWIDAPGTYASLNSSPTFVSETLTATSNQLILGTTRTLTITAPTPATSSRTWTIPDISGNGTFAALEGTQTFSAVNTFSSNAIFSADVYTDAYTDWSPSSTVLGWNTFTSKIIYYKKIGKLVFVWFEIDGTSGATTVSFTLPYTISNTADLWVTCRARDNNTEQTTPGHAEADRNTSTITCFKDTASGAWTNANRKIVQGQFSYQTT